MIAVQRRSVSHYGSSAARWKDGDTQKSKLIDEQKVAAQFVIDDSGGAVPIDAREGGDFRADAEEERTKGTGLVGGITGTTDLEFGNYRVNTPILDVGTKYEVEEEVLRRWSRLYACGRIGAWATSSRPRAGALILSAKSRDELLAGPRRRAAHRRRGAPPRRQRHRHGGLRLESASEEPSSAASVAASTPVADASAGAGSTTCPRPPRQPRPDVVRLSQSP